MTKIFSTRQQRLAQILTENNFHAAAFNPGPTLTYLTGLHFHLMERPVVAIFSPGQPPALILPELEVAKLNALSFEVQPFSYGENPTEWGNIFQQALKQCGLENTTIAIEPNRLRMLEYGFLQTGAPQARFVDGAQALASLRLFKDADEIAAMRRAVHVAQQALEATISQLRFGMSEQELASELTMQLLRHGSQPELPFPPIVSMGIHSANPHATPTTETLRPGELLLIDWGAAVDDYFSDLTRTFALGEAPAEMRRIAEVVAQANTAGRAAARPGIPAGAVDLAARQIIQDAGYGQYFTHRTGHGLGMEAHEPPYLFGENKFVLQPGVTFTVEPGIYLPQKGGVRIEDDVVITADGAESLSDLPRELRRIL